MPAASVVQDPVLHFTHHEDAHAILELGRRGAYKKERTTLIDKFYDFGSTKGATILTFTDASPLHLAIKIGNIQVLSALIAVDPELLDTRATLNIDMPLNIAQRSQFSATIGPARMAALYLQNDKNDDDQTDSNAELVSELIESWSAMHEAKHLMSELSIDERLALLGYNSETVVICTSALGLDSWVEVLYTLIDQDMYSLILHIGRIPDIDMSSEAYAQPHLAPIPLPLLTVFSNLREGDNLLAVDVNLFQRALLMGRFKAACALAVICPDLLSRKLGIVSPEGTKCCISTSIMVKLLCKIAPWEENDACFRIPALADWQRRRSTSTTSLLSHQRQSRRGSLRLVQMQMYSSTNGNKMQ